MNFRQWMTGILLLGLMALAIAGLVRTRPLPPPPAEGEAAAGTPGRHLFARSAVNVDAPHPLVDERPLQTARRMATLAATPEEQALAHAAEKIADHEVDLAFFDALRTAEENPVKLTPETKEILDRKNKAATAVKEDQESVTVLTRSLAAAPDAKKDNLQDQLEVAKAQADLDQDEFDDAAAELEQSGADPQSKISRLKAEHDARDHAPQAAAAVNPAEQDYEAHTVLAVVRAWRALRDKAGQLKEAQQETAAKAERLGHRHDLLFVQVAKETQDRENAKRQAKGFVTGAHRGEPGGESRKEASREESKAGAQTALDSLRQYGRDQKNLADLGKRVQDEKDLDDVYGRWILLVEARQRAALHNLIECLLWILLVLLMVYLVARLIDRLFARMHAENKRIDVMRSVAKVAAEIVGAIRDCAHRAGYAEPDHGNPGLGGRGAYGGEQRCNHGVLRMVSTDGAQRNPRGRLGGD